MWAPVDTRIQRKSRNKPAFAARSRQGAIALQLIVLLGGVLLVFMGFAFDLGRLWMGRAELTTAAQASALAAAQRLIGTDQSLADANTAATQALRVYGGRGNKYDFGGVTIGEGNTFLQSEPPQPLFFDTYAAATENGSAGASNAGGSTARFARVEIRAEAPLVFFGLLNVAQERKVQVATFAVAGISAPVCTACGIEPVAIAALDQEETVDYGYVRGTKYTFYHLCNGNPTPQPLGDAGTRVPYLLLNRLDDTATLFPDEGSQLFRNGNNGIPPNASTTKACLNIGTPELIWATASPRLCNQTAPNPSVNQFLCGLYNRFDQVPSAGACENIAEVSSLSAGTPVDTDLTTVDDYAAYIGNGRRIITIAIIDTLSSTEAMNILAFRQFLIEPDPNSTNITPGDGPGRFIALYIGNPMPLKQGRFGSCGVASGPGKVVLH
jgi:Flp pilus assembly protein TadG